MKEMSFLRTSLSFQGSPFRFSVFSSSLRILLMLMLLFFQCYESAGLFLSETTCQELVRPPTPGPPPAYETVVQEKDKLAAELEAVVSTTDKASSPTTTTPQPTNDDSGLPSYEAALRIEAGGYV